MALILAIVLGFTFADGVWRWLIILAGAVIEVGEAMLLIWLSRRRRSVVGVETTIGARAQVVTACRPDGQVRLGGEIWTARCAAGAAVGDTVIVRAVDGITLVVEPGDT